MATFEKLKFSGSTNNKPIKVVATSTAGTTIHTASTDSTIYDEIWLYATNNHATAVDITVEFGGTSSPDDLIQAQIPAKTGLYLIIPGIPLQGNSSAPVVRVFASVTNVVSILGWVNRITP